MTTPPTPLALYIALLQHPLAHERLEAYRPAGGSDLEALATYVWNIALSEALYPALNGLEVALRNSIHAAGIDAFGGNPLWFVDAAVLPLSSREQTLAREAHDTLRRHGKPLTAGRLVAELPFGFWTGLLNAPYERLLWAPPALGLLSAAFPHVPRRWRSRGRILERLNTIRMLRNRVFHYEPIWNVGHPGIAAQHATLLEVLGWISPALQGTIMLLDRFPDVQSRGPTPYWLQLATFARTLPP